MVQTVASEKRFFFFPLQGRRREEEYKGVENYKG
jgi:hypothetical protein